MQLFRFVTIPFRVVLFGLGLLFGSVSPLSVSPVSPNFLRVLELASHATPRGINDNC
jgi:hypothetical protein